ncbi:MAG: DUF975 family protein [Lachnospiraceae bacterium]|nr:DUF975 family protein [Lachnospiraceae bacterium]
MWTRAELKSRAKVCLKQYYWMAFLACLIAGVLGGASSSSGAGVDITRRINSVTGEQTSTLQEDMGTLFQNVDTRMVVAATMVVGIILIVGWVISICLGTFVGNIVWVGRCRFFMESREKQDSAGLGRLFYCFSKGWYLNVVKVMFLRGLFIGLWTLLLIVPGVIKAYEYYMVPYIMSENPQMDYRDALSLSKHMMDGHKWSTFVLEWSFIGWNLLGALLCGIGGLFVNPYIEATFAELYAVLRQNSGAVGTALPGFGEQQEPYVDYTVVE